MNRRDLSSDLWHACDIMRRDDGTTGVLEYMEQLSWLIFLKIFEDIEKRLKDEAEFARRGYEPIIDKEHQWSSWAKKDWRAEELIQFIDTKLFVYFRSLDGTPERDMIATIFKEIRGNRMKSAYNLREVIDIVDEIDFNSAEDSHIVSQMYEELLLRMGKEGGIAGEFYTPRPVIRLIVKIIDPTVGKRVFDPFCGSCGFLVESFKHIEEVKQLKVEDYERLQRRTYYGQEKKTVPYLFGIMNCILHGLLTPTVIRKNTLEDNIRNIPENQRFEILVTNPPFGGKENKQIQQNFPIQSERTELLALQYVMKHVKKDGRVGIVVPESTLSTGGSFKKVRKELIQEFNIHTIVSLPQGVFANVTTSGQGPRTNLLFFDRDKKTSEIWYYELTPPEGVNYTRANPVKDEDLLDCWNKWQKSEISANSWVVSLDDVVRNGYDLTAKNPWKKETTIGASPEELLSHILENHRKESEILEEADQLLKMHVSSEEFVETPLKQLLTLRRDFFKISNDEEYQRVTVQLHARGIIPRDAIVGSEIKMKKQQRVHSNDLLVAEIDAKVGGFGIVPSELEGAIVSSHYFVYAIDTNRLLPEYLEFYLKTGKPTKDLHTQGFVKGSLNYASIRPNDFLELKIPWASPEIQRRIVALFRKVEELASTNSKKTEMLNALMRSVLDRFLSEAAPEQSSTSFSRREERRDIETATTMNR